MRLDDRKISVVSEVVRRASVRAAAEHLNLDPSVVSRHVAQVEEDIGLSLFERHGRRLQPTAAALLLVDYFREHRIHQNDLKAKLEDLLGMRTGTVRIALGEGFVSDITSGPVQAFKQAHPNVLVRIETMTVDAIVRAVEADEADIGIAHNPPVSTATKSWARRSLPIQFVARPEHPLLQGSHPLTVHEVAAAPLALLAPGFGLRKAVEVVEFLERLQFTPVLETNSVAALKAFALSGAGATLLPFTVVRHECRRRELSISRIDHDVFNNAEMHLLTRSERLLPPAAVRMMSFLNSYVNAVGQKG